MQKDFGILPKFLLYLIGLSIKKMALFAPFFQKLTPFYPFLQVQIIFFKNILLNT
jgi:hypothetical protein